MRNTIKLGFLSLALSLAVAACNSEKKANDTDTIVTDTTIVDTTLTDTTVVDTAAKM